MGLNQLMFIIFFAVITTFSILAVTSRRILRAAVYLLFVLISTAGLYFLLKYEFLAAVQLMLYAGGIVVLIVFSILLTSHISLKFDPVPLGKKLIAFALAFGSLCLVLYTVLNHPFTPSEGASVEVTTQMIGRAMLNYGEHGFVLPFEVISILLLAAMIAAIITAKKQKNS